MAVFRGVLYCVFSRRHVLAGGLSLGLLSGLGAWAWGHRGPGEDLDSPFLGAQPRATLKAAFEVLLPDEAAAERLSIEVDRFLAGDDPELAEQLPMALLLLEHSAGFVGFHRMNLAARRQVLEGWESSSIAHRRQIFQALRRTAVMSFFASPETWAAIGYDGPLVGR